MNSEVTQEGFDDICDVDILEILNEEDIINASECIADCFTGNNLSKLKYEPMNYSLKINKETSWKFVIKYLTEIQDRGKSLMIKDIHSGKIVGAIVTEIYNPDAETVHYSGEFEVYNGIYKIIESLDNKFKEFIEFTTGACIRDKEYLHLQLIAIKVKGKNLNIFTECMKQIEVYSKENSLKGMFTEATNPKSQLPLMNKYGFFNPLDREGKPITVRYEDTDLFKTIPKDVASDCKLLFKKLVLC